MTPPLYKLAAADAGCKALLGDLPRVYPWGEADDPPVYPYVTFQLASGSPGDVLSGRTDHDRLSYQVDVWASTAQSAIAVTQALTRAIETSCYVTSWRSESRDPQTKSYRKSFDVDWIIRRT